MEGQRVYAVFYVNYLTKFKNENNHELSILVISG